MYTEDVVMQSHSSCRHFCTGVKCDLLCILCGMKINWANKMFRELGPVERNVVGVDISE
jgi:hypothetical protein